MPLSDKEIRDLKPTDKRQKKGVGDSLFVVVESVGRGGGKSFIGRTRFPPGRSGKEVEVRIGVYGRGAGKWTLLAARKEWERIRDWSREAGRDPREARAGEDKEPSKTLQDAIDGFLYRRFQNTLDALLLWLRLRSCYPLRPCFLLRSTGV